jgi:hypothetical protein
VKRRERRRRDRQRAGATSSSCMTREWYPHRVAESDIAAPGIPELAAAAASSCALGSAVPARGSPRPAVRRPADPNRATWRHPARSIKP